MKYIFILIIGLFGFTSCENQQEISSVNPVNWEKHRVRQQISDTLVSGKTYLSIYSEIYSESEHRTINLTATISLRNINLSEDVYVEKASYFDTKGNLIRTYFDSPIFLKPLETIEIIIDEKDTAGGSGANFVFDWAIKNTVHEPVFEAVMISTSGQQGISFTTKGIPIK
jgi:hypothetical protein